MAKPTVMRFYNQAHTFYCGVDLHARTMYLYLCILEQREKGGNNGEIMNYSPNRANADQTSSPAIFTSCPAG